MPKNRELFPAKRPRGKTRAPDQLTPPQIRKLSDWAARRVPWISRGAFDAFTPLDEYVDTVLGHFASSGKLKLDWVLTCETWIRKEERERLTRMARSGNDDAKLALRQPEEWARRYDRKQRAAKVATSTGGMELMRPTGGKILRLTPPPNRR